MKCHCQFSGASLSSDDIACRVLEMKTILKKLVIHVNGLLLPKNMGGGGGIFNRRGFK